MWIESRKGSNGTIYVFYERYKDPQTGKLKKVSVSYDNQARATKKQAMLALQEKIEQKLKNNTDALFFIVATEYREQLRLSSKITTAESHLYYEKSLASLFPQELKFSGIKASFLQEAINQFATTHSYSYTRQTFAYMFRIMRYALRLGYTNDISVIDRIEIPKRKKSIEDLQKANSKFLTSPELKIVLHKLTALHPTLALLCEFQALTGLRIGELGAIRLKNYDRVNSIVTIDATISRIKAQGNTPRLDTPKNVYSYRKIKLDPRCKAIIEKFISMSASLRKAIPNLPENDYIFIARSGLPYDSHYINKELKKIDFPKKLTTHIFRHTHASLLAEMNMPLKAVMHRLGHNEPRTTLSVYTHVTAAMEDEVRDAVHTIAKVINT